MLIASIGMGCTIGMAPHAPGDAGARDAREADAWRRSTTPPPVESIDAARPVDAGSSPAVGHDAAIDRARPTRLAVIAPSILVTADRSRAIVADVDAALLHVLSLGEGRWSYPIALPEGSEPQRMVEDRNGRVHVVLRRAGAIATLERDALTVSLRTVCAAPRGIAWRSTDDALVVACADGWLVTMPAASGEPTQRVWVDEDLRDVVTFEGHLFVSRFRSAEVLEIGRDGEILSRHRPRLVAQVDPLSALPGATIELEPHVAWRMVADETRGLWLLHQLHRSTAVPARDEADVTAGLALYETADMMQPACTAVVQSVITHLTLGASGELSLETTPPLPLAGITDLVRGTTPRDDGLVTLDGQFVRTTLGSLMESTTCENAGHALFDSYDGAAGALLGGWGTLLVTRAPLRVFRTSGGTFGLDDHRAPDDGQELFHRISPSGVACASCHPEGGEDGHVWQHEGRTSVRTQALWGGVMDTAPFHWEGELADFDALVSDAWIGRMGGTPVGPFLVDALDRWIDANEPPPAPMEDEALVGRGRELFDSAVLGCSGCHSGAEHTNGATVDVGTGRAVQVPVLRGLAYRAPYFHTGCAETLRDVLTSEASCAGGDAHRIAATLPSEDVDALSAFLASL